MSELTLFLVRIAYLAILWIFVLSAISVIRSDMFGARVPEAARGDARRAGRAPKQPKPPSRRRGTPTHLLVTEGSNAGERVDLGVPHGVGRAERVGQHHDRGVSRSADDVVDPNGAHQATRSKTAARPWPPPMHIVSRP